MVFGAGLHAFDHGESFLVDRLRAFVFALAVECAVAGDAQEPSAERVDVLEVVEIAPRGEEGVLRDIGRGFGVAQYAEGEIVHTVEPAVVELSERGAVAGAGGGDERRIERAARGFVSIGDLGDLVVVRHSSVLTPEHPSRLRAVSLSLSTCSREAARIVGRPRDSASASASSGTARLRRRGRALYLTAGDFLPKPRKRRAAGGSGLPNGPRGPSHQGETP